MHVAGKLELLERFNMIYAKVMHLYGVHHMNSLYGNLGSINDLLLLS